MIFPLDLLVLRALLFTSGQPNTYAEIDLPGLTRALQGNSSAGLSVDSDNAKRELTALLLALRQAIAVLLDSRPFADSSNSLPF